MLTHTVRGPKIQEGIKKCDRPKYVRWLWTSCAVALDGCIYFMPHNARRLMKLDPNNNDAMTSVGDTWEMEKKSTV